MSLGSNGGSGTTQTQVPAWLEDAYKSNLGRANGVADTPFKAYDGTMAAGDNEYLGAARDQAVGASYTGRPQVAQASKIFGEVADQSPNLLSAQQFAGTNLSPYMSPYQSAVIDQSNRQIDRQRQMADDQNAYAATQAGAFGGSRHGVVDAENAKNYAQMQTDNTNSLLNQGFDRATGLASQDVDRRTNNDQFNVGADERNTAFNLQGAQGLLGAGGQQQQMTLNSQNALQQAGQQQQGTQQAGYDAAYNEFMRGQQDPLAKQQLLNQSTLGINAGGTTASTSKGKGFST